MYMFGRYTTALLTAFLTIAPAISGANESLKPWNLLGGKVTMLVLPGLTLMSEADKREKYPGDNAPAYVLTNEDWSTNIAFDHKKLSMKPGEVHELEQPMRKHMSNAKINWRGVRKLNGIEFLLIDADVRLEDATVHNLIAVTSPEGRMLVISYNCILDFDPKCGVKGPPLINSIVLNPGAGK
jgi:hypothetical protein